MAVRFDAVNEEYTRANLGTITQFTITCWVKISVDQNIISAVWGMDNGFAGDTVALDTATNGTTLRVTDDVASHNLSAMTVGRWYYVGVSYNGANATAVFRNPDLDAPTLASWSNGSPSVNAVNLRIGRAVSLNQWFNGCLAAFKMWVGGSLTQDELLAEAWQYTPVRQADLYAFYPFLAGGTAGRTDYGGTGHNLSNGTSTSTEEGPPITWAPRRKLIIVPPQAEPANEVTLDAQLPAFEADVDGAVIVDGQAGAELPAFGADLDATTTAAGQIDAGLPAFGADMDGNVGSPGLLDAALPALDSQFAVDLSGAFLTADLPALEADLDGQALAAGGLAGDLPALAATVHGTLVVPHIDYTVGQPFRAWAAEPAARAWAARRPATAWSSRPVLRPWAAAVPARAWSARQAARRWSARQPTT